jgi:hypothetical protein
MAPRLSTFQEHHTAEFGLTIQHRNDDQKVDSVRCDFCQYFGREAKPGASRAVRTKVRLFTPPYRRECYVAHIESQHPAKWQEYQQLTAQQQLTFFGQTANINTNEEYERLKSETEMLKKKLRKCQEKLRVKEMFSKHDKTKIENLEKEKAQLEELNLMLKGSSDDDSTVIWTLNRLDQFV